MSPVAAIQIALMLPLAASALALLFQQRANLREGSAIACGILLVMTVRSIASGLDAGETYAWAPFEILPGIPFAFEVERLGLLFAGVAAVLWPVTTLYGAGYMRGHREKHQARFFCDFCGFCRNEGDSIPNIAHFFIQ